MYKILPQSSSPSTAWQKEGFFSFVVLTLVVILVLTPLCFNNAIPNLGDCFNHLAAIVQAKQALSEGQFPLRVAPLEYSGWRYPLYQFYSPSAYTGAALIYRWLTPANPLMAYKLMLGCFLLLGGIYMHRLSYWFIQSSPLALLAGVIYLTNPYYLIVLHHLAAFNEALALGALPAVLFYTFKRYYHPQEASFLLLAGLSWYLLATLHLITFLYSSCCVIFLLLFMSLRQVRPWKNFLAACVAYFFGFLLALWYLAPIILIGNDLMIQQSFDANFYLPLYPAPLLDLLSPMAHILPGTVKADGNVSSITKIHPSLGLPALFAIIGYFYLKLCGRQTPYTNSNLANALLPCLPLLFLSLVFMAWSPVNFWKYLPTAFFILQYPWRLLGQTLWISSLLCVWVMATLNFSHLYLRLTLLLTLAAGILWLPAADTQYASLKNFPQQLSSATDAYLLDPHKPGQFPALIDSLPLSTARTNVIPLLFLQKAQNSFITISGAIPEDFGNSAALQLTINKTFTTTQQLKPGPFLWKLPLHTLKEHPLPTHWQTSADYPQAPLLLDLQWLKTPAKRINLHLGGFLKEREILDVNQVAAHCQSASQESVCKLRVPLSVHLLELPLLYYPELLDIRLNGKTVPYQSVLFHGQQMAAITPLSGTLNTIRFQFQGVFWANWLSLGCWGLLMLFIIYKLTTRPKYIAMQL